MAVQEPKPMRLCEKCFATVPPNQDFCPECGAKYSKSAFSEGSDAAIYPELARANLLRMRGDYKQAEEVCLKVLRRFPNNASANTLLGDICAECGELDQAISWYELALDLNPESKADRDKLEAVRQRKADHEAATTAKLLGLPTTRSKGVLVAVVFLLFIVAVGLVSYTVGRNLVSSRQAPLAVVDVPVTIPSQPLRNPPRPPDSSVSPAEVKEDQDLLSLLASASPIGTKLIAASRDPRTNETVLTFRCNMGENVKAVGAQLAAIALDKVRECGKVVIRGAVEGQLAMVAEVRREDLERTKASEWTQQYGNDSGAWTDSVVTNEWWSESYRQKLSQ